MKITYKNAAKLTKKFQAGGPVESADQPVVEQAPEEMEGAPEEQAPEDPMMQLVEIFSQGLQNQDCQALAQGAQMFLQLVQQAQGGAEPQGEPVYRKGGKLAYKIQK